jgi:hypothetical protein
MPKNAAIAKPLLRFDQSKTKLPTLVQKTQFANLQFLQ